MIAQSKDKVYTFSQAPGVARASLCEAQDAGGFSFPSGKFTHGQLADAFMDRGASSRRYVSTANVSRRVGPVPCVQSNRDGSEPSNYLDMPLAIHGAGHVEMVLSQQGHVVKSQLLGLPPVWRVNGKRGKCSTVRSAASRRRLLEKTNIIDHASMCPDNAAVWLTLTLTDPLPNSKELHAGWKRFRTWIDRTFDHPVCVWGVEYGEETGRVHFHFLMYHCDAVLRDKGGFEKYRDGSPGKDLMTALWKKGMRNYAGHISMDLRSPEQCLNYIGKYIAKGSGVPATVAQGRAQCACDTGAGREPSTDLSKVHICTNGLWEGRTWGIWNRNKLQFHDLERVTIAVMTAEDPDVKRAYALSVRSRRVLRGWVKGEYRRKLAKAVDGVKTNLPIEWWDASHPHDKGSFPGHDRAWGAFKHAYVEGRGSVIWDNWEQWAEWIVRERKMVRFPAKVLKNLGSGVRPQKGIRYPRFTLFIPDSLDYIALLEWCASTLPLSSATDS